jgi:hypothetical protein
MKNYKLFRGLLVACCLLVLGVGTAFPQEKAAAGVTSRHLASANHTLLKPMPEVHLPGSNRNW